MGLPSSSSSGLPSNYVKEVLLPLDARASGLKSHADLRGQAGLGAAATRPWGCRLRLRAGAFGYQGTAITRMGGFNLITEVKHIQAGASVPPRAWRVGPGGHSGPAESPSSWFSELDLDRDYQIAHRAPQCWAQGRGHDVLTEFLQLKASPGSRVGTVSPEWPIATAPGQHQLVSGNDQLRQRRAQERPRSILVSNLQKSRPACPSCSLWHGPMHFPL